MAVRHPSVNQGNTTDEDQDDVLERYPLYQDEDYMCYDDDDSEQYVGAYENFALSYGLKPWDVDEVFDWLIYLGIKMYMYNTR